ncbi:hypothetical protein HHK36_024627 [Tetracentron sinense]|uniref:Metallo-beta-lactamase domain-containing protein n=1 Tax=Tetracentron sinense TaxID=13715 RepID=A0A834YNF1_TETSI|nr:hypothetical protein HHK36_024627 [Tetracentron sinense]
MAFSYHFHEGMPYPHLLLDLQVLSNAPNVNDWVSVEKVLEAPRKGAMQEQEKGYLRRCIRDIISTLLLTLAVSRSYTLNKMLASTGSHPLKNILTSKVWDSILKIMGFSSRLVGPWSKFLSLTQMLFGCNLGIDSVYILMHTANVGNTHADVSKWVTIQSCLNSLLEVKPSSDRVGSLVVVGLLNDLTQFRKWKVPCTLHHQEYPPGVIVVPMGSRTAKPFRTTNLVVFVPENVTDGFGDKTFVVNGDALIVDPGCLSEFHAELMEIVAALPRKLVVFVTHHHHDHVDGLSVIQKCNPDATLLAHENTMRRIGKDNWSLGYTSISGAEEICIGGQQLNVIFAPGHTDGHMALHHVGTHSLIVGDHCVGQGSAVLDIRAVGKEKDYFQTTYNFLELSPHALIPIHGRLNLWPKHMLCGYLKNRRNRESSILKAIEGGAETLFDIVAKTYSDVDPSFWIPAASNVRLHVDHLSQQDKLPKGFSLERFNCSIVAFSAKEFSVEKFQRTCRIHFLSRWMWAYLRNVPLFKDQKQRTLKLLTATAVTGFAMLYTKKTVEKLAEGEPEMETGVEYFEGEIQCLLSFTEHSVCPINDILTLVSDMGKFEWVEDGCDRNNHPSDLSFTWVEDPSKVINLDRPNADSLWICQNLKPMGRPIGNGMVHKGKDVFNGALEIALESGVEEACKTHICISVTQHMICIATDPRASCLCEGQTTPSIHAHYGKPNFTDSTTKRYRT